MLRHSVVLLAAFHCALTFSIRDIINGKRADSAVPCPTWHPFACPSGECVPIKYLCDGSPDCSDEYDENKSMCTAATRPPVEETQAFLKALMAAHGKDFLVKVFGPKAKSELSGMGGVDKVAVALSQTPTADLFAAEMKLDDAETQHMLEVMEGILNGSTDELTSNESADFRFFVQKLQETGFF
ncbi:unnamed protein product [Caenorhabditis bovis]|uniref:Prohormone-4 n=1 Tax=Caenorhabditis bovis TaxID=2654633 RepID=A0A8S1E5F1_9PELO|nr:unnamed protein product [Caenorhabditis bovis]